MASSTDTSHQPKVWIAFLRHQIAAILATAADFGLYKLLYDFWHIHPSMATIFSSLVGASISYTLGRYWAFKATHANHSQQMVRYALVSLGSAGLNSLGIFVLFDQLGVDEMWSKVIVATCIGIPYNFFLHKNWVFKQ